MQEVTHFMLSEAKNKIRTWLYKKPQEKEVIVLITWSCSHSHIISLSTSV